MSLFVLKFGGSSVATPARIFRVAEIVSEFVKKGDRVVVVTSAMQGVTNRLIELTKSFSESPFNREYDAVISSGEQVAAGLLALALNSVGFSAKSFSAWQIPIEVIENYSDAEIIRVDSKILLRTLQDGIIPVITGFQGVSKIGNICTLGRGGSDATACAVSNAIGADECLIYTDVDGIYTADPRIVLDSQKLLEISYDDMIELAFWGAKVLQTKSTLIAQEYNVKLKVLSSFSNGLGTDVTNQTKYVLSNSVTGIAHNLDLFLLTSSNLNIFNIIKSFVYFEKDGSCLISKTSQADTKAALSGFESSFEIDNDIGITTIVGMFSDDIMIKIIEDVCMSKNIICKKLIRSKRSISILTPFQQAELLVNSIHERLV